VRHMRLPSLTVLAFAGAVAAAQAEDAPFSNPARFPERDGAAIYAATCQGCHMPGGVGAVGAGAYPALASNPHLADAGYPVALVVNGRKGMPGFARTLTDEQIVAVVDYVRTHFGNDYTDKTDAAAAKALRP
jgi:mono/diheme cytochrome c family protein